MEKRRKKKFKKKQEELSDDELSDTESCISGTSRGRLSTTSSRPYLLPTETTGRTNSITYGSTRSLSSQQSYKNQTRYLGNHSRNEYQSNRDRLSSTDRRPESFSYYNNGMNRSTSMVDISRPTHIDSQDLRHHDRNVNMRRSYSAVDLSADPSSHFNQPSVAKSDWSIRTEPVPPPSGRYYGSEINYGGATELDQTQNAHLKRAMSQPDLRRSTAVNRTRTYPQGILKRSNSSRELSASHQHQNDYFGERPSSSISSGRGTLQSEQMIDSIGSSVGGRPRSRPSSTYGGGSVQGSVRGGTNSLYGNSTRNSRYGDTYKQQQYPVVRHNRNPYEDPYSTATAGYMPPPPPYSTNFRMENEQQYKAHDPYASYDPYSAYQPYPPPNKFPQNNTNHSQYYCY